MESQHKTLLLHIDAQWFSWGKWSTYVIELQAELAIFSTEHHFYLKEWSTNYGNLDLSNWQTCSQKWVKWTCHFKKKKKWLMVFVTNDKNWALKQKSEFWKTCISYRKLGSFLILENFLMRPMEIVTNVIFLVLYDEIYQHLEDLHNSVNLYFPNDQCTILQNQAWVKDSKCKRD